MQNMNVKSLYDVCYFSNGKKKKNKNLKKLFWNLKQHLIGLNTYVIEKRKIFKQNIYLY